MTSLGFPQMLMGTAEFIGQSAKALMGVFLGDPSEKDPQVLDPYAAVYMFAMGAFFDEGVKVGTKDRDNRLVIYPSNMTQPAWRSFDGATAADILDIEQSIRIVFAQDDPKMKVIKELVIQSLENLKKAYPPKKRRETHQNIKRIADYLKAGKVQPLKEKNSIIEKCIKIWDTEAYQIRQEVIVCQFNLIRLKTLLNENTMSLRDNLLKYIDQQHCVIKEVMDGLRQGVEAEKQRELKRKMEWESTLSTHSTHSGSLSPVLAMPVTDSPRRRRELSVTDFSFSPGSPPVARAVTKRKDPTKMAKISTEDLPKVILKGPIDLSGSLRTSESHSLVSSAASRPAPKGKSEAVCVAAAPLPAPPPLSPPVSPLSAPSQFARYKVAPMREGLGPVLSDSEDEIDMDPFKNLDS